MKKWIERYHDSIELLDSSVDVLTGFNANIDVVHQASDLDISEVEPELYENPSSEHEMKASLKHCMEKGANNELDIHGLDIDLPGEEFIGGQAGIISNYLASTGNGVIFYTPLLSKELAEQIDEKVLYPVIDGEFMLKNVRDASNTDRTKRNHIFEFEEDGKTGRMILSDTLKGFGPYFRKGVEENLDLIEENVDCAILSGFHDIEGNIESRLRKAENQLVMFEKPVHLEYVDRRRETTEMIVKHILPEADSLGIDETEFRGLMDILEIDDIEDESLSLGEAFRATKKLLKSQELQRVHLHTYRYHLIVVSEEYRCPAEKIRKSMLYAEISAIMSAETGKIAGKEEIESFDMDNKELNGLKELEHFEDFFNLENFVEKGVAEIEGFKVVAIPTTIHKDPEKLVGMGDIISAGAFSSEFR